MDEYFFELENCDCYAGFYHGSYTYFIETFLSIRHVYTPMEQTMIRVSTDTREKLKEMGRMGETYDEVISRLYDKVFNKKVEKEMMDLSDCILVEDMEW